MASRVKGASKLRRQLKLLPLEIRAPIRETLQRGGATIEAALEADAPKDKGNLARAAHHRVSSDGLGMQVGYSQNKPGFKRQWTKGRGFESLFAEFGTRHHAAQPFIRKNFRQGVRAVLDDIDRTVSAVIRRAMKS